MTVARRGIAHGGGGGGGATLSSSRWCVMACCLVLALVVAVLSTVPTAVHGHSSTRATAMHRANARALRHADAWIQEADENLAEMEEAEAEFESQMSDDLEMEPSLVEVESSSYTQRRSPSRARTNQHHPRNAPIQAVVRSPKGAKLNFKASMPARLRFARMVAEAGQRLKDEKEPKQKPAHKARAPQAKDKMRQPRSLLSAGSRAKVHSRATSRVADDDADGGDGDGGDGDSDAAADGGDGDDAADGADAAADGGDAADGADASDWATAPVWWKSPGDENVKPWQEDNYGYMLKHHGDPNSNMSPDPYPTLAVGRFGGGASSPFGLSRVLNTPAVAGAPASVHAYQYPGAPPLPELDANMQPTNNYPNPPFYEHDYNKDYIWG